MAERKKSKSTTGKSAKAGASRGKSTKGVRRSKMPVTTSATVIALVEKTRRRIKEIERQALGKLRRKDADQ